MTLQDKYRERVQVVIDEHELEDDRAFMIMFASREAIDDVRSRGIPIIEIDPEDHAAARETWVAKPDPFGWGPAPERPHAIIVPTDFTRRDLENAK